MPYMYSEMQNKLSKTRESTLESMGQIISSRCPIFFSRTGSSRILKLGMQHWGLKLYKVCINGDPGLTLTYFTARSNLVT